jgi:hypothetical protein
MLGLGIEGRGGLVEDQQPRVPKQCPGDGQSLALAAGKGDAPFADGSPIALGEGSDEAVRVGQPGCRFDLPVARGDAAQTQVLSYRTREQHRVLPHQADGGAELRQGDRREIGAAQQDASLLGLVEPQ